MSQKRGAVVVVALVVGLLAGLFVGGLWDRTAGADAQDSSKDGSSAQYSISAYGTGGDYHGAYIVDQKTGRVFWVGNQFGVSKRGVEAVGSIRK